MSAKNSADQYYTNPDYAKECYNLAKRHFGNDVAGYVEPCAGTGSFLKCMPSDKRIGLDLFPANTMVGMRQEPQNFLEFTETLTNFVAVTNPPFGKNASLAVEFFNKLGELEVKLIALIVPKSFRKASVINRLDNNFHLIDDKDTPPNAFILDGKPYDVPCCFQIWEYRNEKRKPLKTDSENDFIEFVKKNEDHNIVIRRAGSKAGQPVDNPPESGEGMYYIKIKQQKNIDTVLKALQNLDVSDVSGNTAGVRSVSKLELVNALEKGISHA